VNRYYDFEATRRLAEAGASTAMRDRRGREFDRHTGTPARSVLWLDGDYQGLRGFPGLHGDFVRFA
jgi:hypothetical protein